MCSSVVRALGWKLRGRWFKSNLKHRVVFPCILLVIFYKTASLPLLVCKLPIFIIPFFLDRYVFKGFVDDIAIKSYFLGRSQFLKTYKRFSNFIYIILSFFNKTVNWLRNLMGVRFWYIWSAVKNCTFFCRWRALHKKSSYFGLFSNLRGRSNKK